MNTTQPEPPPHDLDLLTAVHPKGPLKAMMRRKYIVYFRDVSSYINSKWIGAKIQMWYFVYYYINERVVDFSATYDLWLKAESWSLNLKI